jgi:amidase
MLAGMSDDLAFVPAVELARLVADRTVSPVETVTLFCDRIARLDKELNSVVTLDVESALAVAREQERLVGTADGPPFLGVPILVKDLSLTRGLRSTCGTATMAEFIPDIDDEHVARLRHAGFVILGKTNVPEWGTLPFTESALLGPCRNPWDLAHTPGGSSGGAAAAMAAALVPVAHASDGAGSIRIPASNCGVFGLKPARGRITKAPLYGEGLLGLGVAGPIARYVVDAAALLDVMRGAAPGDPYWAPDPPRPYVQEAATDPPPLRIGLVDDAPWATFEPVALTALAQAATLFEDLGHVVEPCTLPLSDRLRADWLMAWSAGLAATPADHATFEPFNTQIARMGAGISGARLLQVKTSLEQQASAIVRASMAFDAMCCPTLTRPPLKIGELARLDSHAMLGALAGYVALAPIANVTGQPAMSLPLHWTDDGLPVGVMVTGRPADETTLFQLAGQVERAQNWPVRRPPIS